jgi:hypothetical protein
MALPDYSKTQSGTPKTIKTSGGDAVVTLTSLANGNGTSAGARQTQTLFLGPKWAQRWKVDVELEMAATPTAGNSVNFYASYTNENGAGQGNTSGNDAPYTGYNNDIDVAIRQLEFLGAHICSAIATPTIQKSLVGLMFPKGPYVNLVIDNRSGAAFHSSAENMVIRLTPLEESVEDSL